MPFQFTTPQSALFRLPVKDAVRSVRFAVRRGQIYGRIGPIPLPGAPLLDAAPQRVGRAIHHLEALTSGLAHSLLDEAPTSARWQTVAIEDIDALDRSDVVFAEVAYKGLKLVLRSLGARDCLVSEVHAAEAYRAVASPADDGADRFSRAAALVVELVDRRAVVDVILGPNPQQGGSTGEVGVVAPFALVLWLFARPVGSEPRSPGMIDASAQIARVLAPQIVANLHNPAGMRDLIAFYSDKL